MNLKTVTITDLIPHPNNPNNHPAKQVDALGDSLDTFDQIKNVVVWQGRVLAGHGLVEAAKKTRRLTLEAVDVSHWDEAKATAFMLADIRLPDMAFIDDQVMAEALRVIDKPLDIPGFDEDFLAGLPGWEPEIKEEPGPPQIDRAEELQKEYGTALGQIWQLGEHRLAVGDCTDRVVVEAVMGREAIKNVLTDPPYGISWNTDYTRFTTEYGTQRINHNPVINDDAPFDPSSWLEYPKVILWGANWYCKYIPLGSWLVWDKRYASGSAWLSDAEIAWMKGGQGVYLYAETVQGAHRKERSMHPTQKPVGLMMWCIEKSEMTSSIFDPFLGSGTTLIAAHQLERRCYGIEIDPGYAAVTLKRWSDLTGEDPILESGQ